MDPPQRTPPDVKGNIALNQFRIQPLRSELFLAPSARKEAALIMVWFKGNLEYPRQFCLMKEHDQKCGEDSTNSTESK